MPIFFFYFFFFYFFFFLLCNVSNVCADSLKVLPGTSTARKDSTRSRSAVKSTGIIDMTI